jgi:hypothetical protein
MGEKLYRIESGFRIYTELEILFGFFNSGFIALRTNVASVSNAGNVSQNPKTSFSFV